MKLPIALLLIPLALPAADKLQIYFIDVEGGASTLVVTAAGETVLMDAGYPGFDGRDPKRIAHVLKQEAKADKIDYFLTSHFHGDHVGGVAELAKLVPINQFVDHGDSVDAGGRGKAVWDAYLATAGSKRKSVKPGDKLLLKGVDLTIVASHSQTLSKPLTPAGPNPHCADAKMHPEDAGENGKSLGYLLKVGDFEFANLGDLSWNFQHAMACPVNLIGEVDLYQVAHHGVRDDVAPQQARALNPTVAVMNNGPHKGGGAEAYEHVMGIPGLKDLWQLHRALGNDAAHNTAEERTANTTDIDGCEAHWIRAALHDDGSYTVTNSRNNHSKTYKSKP